MLQRLNLPFKLDGMAWRYANPARANRRHHHAELELNLVTRGTGTYLLRNRRYEIRRGDLLWLFPAQEHILIEQTPDFQMWIAVFKRRTIRRHATDAGSRPLLQKSLATDACRRLKQQDLIHFEEIFSNLSAASAEPGLLNAGLAYALLHTWKCFQRAGEVQGRQIHPSVERAAHLIIQDSSAHSLDELAHHAGLSPSRLSRLFKEQTGLSIVDFRNRQRMQRFLEQYDAQRKTGHAPTLLEAAFEAGFGSYPQFHRVFRQLAGCSPAEYQKRHNL